MSIIINAKKLYKKLKQKNVHDSIMMDLYLNTNNNQKVIQLFDELMRKKRNKPNSTIFLNILKACSNLNDINKGKQIHKCLVENYSNLSNVFNIPVKNTLITMYGNW